jgi:hypothetical protein
MNGLQYLTDSRGERTAVVMPIEGYETLLGEVFDEVDDPELLTAMLEAENSPVVSREEVFRVLESKS